ncbi:MAG: glycosyltransferase family 4 protein [Anaerolineae bacterium]
MKKRTILIMGRVLDQLDGLGVYTANLLRHVFEKDRESNYLVLLRTDNNATIFDGYDNVKVEVQPSRSKLLWDQVLVPLAARRHRADIIFNPKFSLPLLSGRAGVFVLHGSDWFANPGNYTWWDNIYIRVMLPLYCRKAKRLLSIAQIAVDDLAKYIGLDTGKVTVNYAAPAPHFKRITDKPVLDDFARRYHLPDRYILTVGRVYHSGHDNLDEYPGGNNESLVRGYQKYRALGGTLPLVVVGRDIEDYLRGHGFDDKDLEGLHFTGFIPNTEIVNAYNLADFFVLATLYECFPLPLIESMACGCPALVPSTGGCPELGVTAARYINPLDTDEIGNAMFEIAGSDQLRAEMREAGLKRAAMFSWGRTADLTLEVFDKVCSGSA